MVSLLLLSLAMAQEAPAEAQPTADAPAAEAAPAAGSTSATESTPAAEPTPTATTPEAAATPLSAGAGEAPSPGAAPIVHVPVAEADPDKPLPVSFTCDDVRGLGQVELMYRRSGDTEWRSLGFQRLPEAGWVATIPPADVVPPGVEYYIKSPRGARFASAQAPYVVEVQSPPQRAHREVELARFDGHRSRVSAAGFYANFGPQGDLVDRWYGGDFDFTYRVLGAVRTVRFGVSRTWADGIFPSVDGPVNQETGLAMGFAELEFQPVDVVGLTTQVQLGANATSFTAGGELGLRIGPAPGTHVRLYGGGTAGLGLKGGMELAWDTVPHVPMAAGVEVTNWPTAGEEWAIRLLYDLEIPLGKQADLLLGVNYQARASDYGGFGGRGGLAWSF